MSITTAIFQINKSTPLQLRFRGNSSWKSQLGLKTQLTEQEGSRTHCASPSPFPSQIVLCHERRKQTASGNHIEFTIIQETSWSTCGEGKYKSKKEATCTVRDGSGKRKEGWKGRPITVGELVRWPFTILYRTGP